jgi:hypothetical protein
MGLGMGQSQLRMLVVDMKERIQRKKREEMAG